MVLRMPSCGTSVKEPGTNSALTASSDAPAAFGAAALGAPAPGVGPARAAGTCGADAAGRAVATLGPPAITERTSRSITRPWGPEPRTLAISMPPSLAIRRARGEAKTRPWPFAPEDAAAPFAASASTGLPTTGTISGARS